MPIKKLVTVCAIAAATLAPAQADHVVTVGGAVPNFKVTDHTNKVHEFDKDLKGKIVVLEWTNKDCPFAGGAYYTPERMLMPEMQKNYTAKGIIWLSVISSAPGKEGYIDTKNEGGKKHLEMYKNATAVIIDDKADLANMFHAKVTTTVAVIDREGKLAYFGSATDKDHNQNFLSEATESILKGEPVKTPETQAFGCGIKNELK